MASTQTQARPTGKAHRRSKRLKLLVPVEVIAFQGEIEAFRERAQMLSVNAHGGLLALAARVSEGQMLRLVNHRTAEQQECRVVNVGPVEDGRMAVGIEFTCPSADFWKISFPPANGRAAADFRN